MPYQTPRDIAQGSIETGSINARLFWDRALVVGFLAGASSAIAGVLVR
jgi:hypothetical protein